VLARLLFRVSPTPATTDAIDAAVMLIVAVGPPGRRRASQSQRVRVEVIRSRQ
jgi:hypothetical protein